MYTFTETKSGQTRAYYTETDGYNNKLTITTNYPTLELTKYAHLYNEIKPFYMSLENDDESVISEWSLGNIRQLHQFLGQLLLQYELCDTTSTKETPIDEMIEIIE